MRMLELISTKIKEGLIKLNCLRYHKEKARIRVTALKWCAGGLPWSLYY